MSTKHWKISLRKDGELVTLFVTTTDQMVDLDLDGDDSHSLIRAARQYHRRAQTPEQDHRDLAIGAFMAHAVEPLYDRTDAHIESTVHVPNTSPLTYVGGARNIRLVPLWEEADDFR